jgi:hypothetical protein
MVETISCPACQGDLPARSRFCPQCGVPLGQSETAETQPETLDAFTHRPSADTREFLASQDSRPRASIHESHRRPLGAPPPAFLGALSLAALLLVLILLITGSWIGATIALGAFIGLITLFIPAVRHDPDSQAARLTRRSVSNATNSTRFAAVAARSWTQAGISLLKIKQRRLRLKRELRSQLTPLGEAVHHGDQARAEDLKARADELEKQLEMIDADASAIVEGAREAVEREKTTSQPTQTLPPTETEVELIHDGRHRAS